MLIWCLIDGCLMPVSTPQGVVLGITVLDDEGVIRAWEVMHSLKALPAENAT